MPSLFYVGAFGTPELEPPAERPAFLQPKPPHKLSSFYSYRTGPLQLLSLAEAFSHHTEAIRAIALELRGATSLEKTCVVLATGPLGGTT